MPMKKITEKQKKELGEIVKADPEFVSMVRHAANRQGFRVVKSETEKSHPSVHSLMIPKGLTVAEVASEGGCDWVTDIDTQFTDKGDYLEAILADRDKFDSESFGFQKIGTQGALALVGLMKSDGISNKSYALPMAMDEGDVSPGDSFRQAFLSESSAFQQVVLGLLNQSQMSIDDLKSSIQASFDSFSKSLTMLLDNIPPDANQGEYDSAEVVDDLMKSDETGGQKMEQLFETKEEMAAFMKEVMKSELDGMEKRFNEKLESSAPKTEAPVEKPAEKSDESKTEESEKADARFEELSQQIETLTEVISVKSHADDEVDEEYIKMTQKWEEFPSGVPKEHRKGIFSGCLGESVR